MHKANMVLNGEWGQHVKVYTKKYTSKARRRQSREVVAAERAGKERRENP